jgi:hypothetical protein
MKKTEEKDWWGRNWKWCVPVGVLGSILLFACFAAAILCIVFGAMKSSTVYKESMAKTVSAQAVIDQLGEPIEDALYLSGTVRVNGPSGHADIAIPVSGPKGKGTIYAAASKSAGQWTFSTLVVEIRETNERINLLD